MYVFSTCFSSISINSLLRFSQVYFKLRLSVFKLNGTNRRYITHTDYIYDKGNESISNGTFPIKLFSS